MESRCCSSPAALSCGLSTLDLQPEAAVVLAFHAQAPALGDVDTSAADLGADRQLPATTVGEHHQRDARRAPIVEQLVHRGTHRTTGVQDVVDKQQVAAF